MYVYLNLCMYVCVIAHGSDVTGSECLYVCMYVCMYVLYVCVNLPGEF